MGNGKSEWEHVPLYMSSINVVILIKGLYIREPHGVEIEPHRYSVELTRYGTMSVTAQLQAFILSVRSIPVEYESPYVVYLPEGGTYFWDILLY